MKRSFYIWLLTAALAALALFQDKPWRSLEVFDADEGGYYAYLPAAFIYGDLGRPDSLAILQQAALPPKVRELGLRRLTNGKYISKYWLGTALGNLPWFAGAHAYAGLTRHPQDGFSRPYQQAVTVSGLVYALFGLWLVRGLVREYFDDTTTAWTVAAVGLGTNFLAYASYNAAMAHAPLFLWQAALVCCTVRWYRGFHVRHAVGMGVFLGMAVLVRPTEVLYAVVPLLWGLSSRAAWRERPRLWRRHAGQLAGAGAIALALVSLQPLYWHAVSGQWLLDTYGAERFTFTHPHLWEGLFSFRKGWLLYTPLAGVALLGVWPLRRRVPAAVAPILVLVPLVVYVTFSWEQWWYGGGFSARPLVSLYPLLALPLAAVARGAAPGARLRRGVIGVFILLNLWQTYQYAAGIIHYDQQTAERYFRKFFDSTLEE